MVNAGYSNGQLGNILVSKQIMATLKKQVDKTETVHRLCYTELRDVDENTSNVLVYLR